MRTSQGRRAAASDQACLDTGVGANLRAPVLDSPAGQYNFLQGGNLELQPETSDTYTYGVVFQPSFLPKLAMSVDYFDIEILDTISTFGADNTLNACYFQNDQAACGRIQRDANGSLWRGDGVVEDLNINIGSLSTTGWDLSVSYTGVELGSFGELSFNLVGTKLDELITVPVRVSPRSSAKGSSPVPRAAPRARTGGITSASAGSRPGTWTWRSPGVTTTP